MQVIAVEDDADQRRFLEMAAPLYRDDSSWYDGSRFAAEADLAGASAFLRYGSMRAFLCEDGERTLGRVAAFVNPRLRDPAGAPLGQIGYFESVDDPRVAAELLGPALAWLRGRGAARVVGPMAGGAHRPHRVMTRGFDREPFVLEPRNPPYYPRLIEGAGFTRLHAWLGYDWTPDVLRSLLEHLRPMAAVARDGGRYRIERLDPRRPDRVFPRIHRMLDEAWSGHTGYAPLEFDELVESFTPLLAMMDEDCLGVAVESADDRDVGFAFTLPDHMEAVRALGHDRDLWARWLGETRHARPRRILLHTIALAPSARGTGVAAWLIHDIAGDALARGYDRVAVALVDETFRLFSRIAPPTREHVLYARKLS